MSQARQADFELAGDDLPWGKLTPAIDSVAISMDFQYPRLARLTLNQQVMIYLGKVDPSH